MQELTFQALANEPALFFVHHKQNFLQVQGRFPNLKYAAIRKTATYVVGQIVNLSEEPELRKHVTLHFSPKGNKYELSSSFVQYENSFWRDFSFEKEDYGRAMHEIFYFLENGPILFKTNMRFRGIDIAKNLSVSQVVEFNGMKKDMLQTAFPGVDFGFDFDGTKGKDYWEK